jgi:DNA repair exonuclease SbcCD ATPase subunit
MGKIEELSILIKKNLILEEEYLRNIRLDKENRNEIEKENLVLEELKKFLLQISANYRENICSLFTSLVTEALTSIFEKDIIFEIKLYSYRNEPAIDIAVIEDGLEVDPQKSCGGGVNDIISLVLKVIFIYLKNSNRILILDESLKFLSRNYLEQASSFLRDISERMNLQIVLVSHKPELEVGCDNLITIEKENNRSVIINENNS